MRKTRKPIFFYAEDAIGAMVGEPVQAPVGTVVTLERQGTTTDRFVVHSTYGYAWVESSQLRYACDKCGVDDWDITYVTDGGPNTYCEFCADDLSRICWDRPARIS